MVNEFSASPVQLSLGVSLHDEATFANYFVGQNGLAVSVLRSLASGADHGQHVIWGTPGCGITHLMQAVCRGAHGAGYSVQYLSMPDIVGYNAENICDGLDNAHVVCLDGVEAVAGMREWEVGLFHLFNRLRDAGRSLLIGSHVSPVTLGITLPDLKSRVLGCPVYRIEGLNDEQKQEVLMMRADARGMKMPEDVAKYILHHASRNMNDLFYLLNTLDAATIQQQRKLSIPFVKQVFGDSEL